MNSNYKCKILISTPDISGDIFSRSVVLIIDHNENGAFGLILNKRNSEFTQLSKSEIGFHTDIYEGGPVEKDKHFMIVRGTPITDEFLQINSDFYITEDLKTLTEKVLKSELNIQDVKIFQGYSGWSAFQLENEISRKVWTVVEVYNLDYTMRNDENLWKNIMQNLGGEYLLWANAPANINLN